MTVKNSLEEQEKIELDESQFNFRISPVMHKKIESVIRLLRVLEHRRLTKQDWLIEALKDRLESENEIPTRFDRTFSSKLPLSLQKDIEKHIDLINKTCRQKISKRFFVIDAILEKLDKDEAMLRKKIAERNEKN